MKEQVEQEVIIRNHKLPFYFSDPSKKMLHSFFTYEFTCQSFDQPETRLVLERDQMRNQAKRHILQTLFVKFFCRKLNKRNSRSLLEFARID